MVVVNTSGPLARVALPALVVATALGVATWLVLAGPTRGSAPSPDPVRHPLPRPAAGPDSASGDAVTGPAVILPWRAVA